MGNSSLFKRHLFHSTYLETGHSCPQKITIGGQHYNQFLYKTKSNESNDENRKFRMNGFYKTKSNVSMTYSTFEIIGEGAFGIVYGSRNQNNELLAVKYKKNLKDIDLMKKSQSLFRGEIEALFNLEHKNIVKLAGIEFIDNEVVSIVMEYIPGDTLNVFIRNEVFLEETLVKSFTKQLVHAISYMHSKFIIHRDIKSSNIIIVNKKTIKLIDFGMAKLLNVNPESYQVYPTNSCVGTVPYMAPEVRTFQGYDSKADIFSIGALVYEMATGDVYVHNVHDGIGMLSQLNNTVEVTNLSKDGNDFVNQCLIKDASFRPFARALLKHKFLSASDFKDFKNTLSKKIKNPFITSN